LNPISAPTAHLEFEGNYGDPHGKLMFDINGVMDVPRDTWKSWGCNVVNDDPVDDDWTKMSWKVANAQT
jgi:hypothetical protein